MVFVFLLISSVILHARVREVKNAVVSPILFFWNVCVTGVSFRFCSVDAVSRILDDNLLRCPVKHLPGQLNFSDLLDSQAEAKAEAAVKAEAAKQSENAPMGRVLFDPTACRF